MCSEADKASLHQLAQKPHNLDVALHQLPDPPAPCHCAGIEALGAGHRAAVEKHQEPILGLGRKSPAAQTPVHEACMEQNTPCKSAPCCGAAGHQQRPVKGAESLWHARWPGWTVGGPMHVASYVRAKRA